MLNKLNKSVTNKRLFGLCCQRFRCLRTRSTSEPTKESETDVPNRRRTQNVDYLSIFDITSEDIAGTRDRTYDGQQSVGKYEELVEGRTVKMSDEKYMTTSFGRVRLDSDNRPKIHGHYDPTNQRLRFDVAEFEEKLKTVPMPTAESHKGLCLVVCPPTDVVKGGQPNLPLVLENFGKPPAPFIRKLLGEFSENFWIFLKFSGILRNF